MIVNLLFIFILLYYLYVENQRLGKIGGFFYLIILEHNGAYYNNNMVLINTVLDY